MSNRQTLSWFRHFQPFSSRRLCRHCGASRKKLLLEFCEQHLLLVVFTTLGFRGTATFHTAHGRQKQTNLLPNTNAAEKVRIYPSQGVERGDLCLQFLTWVFTTASAAVPLCEGIYLNSDDKAMWHEMANASFTLRSLLPTRADPKILPVWTRNQRFTETDPRSFVQGMQFVGPQVEGILGTQCREGTRSYSSLVPPIFAHL